MPSTSSFPFRLASAVAVAALLASSGARAADPASTPPDRTPIALAAPASFAAAASAVEKATGAKAEKLAFGDVTPAEGRSFTVDHRVAERLLAGSHATFLKAGFYLFRYERSFGVAGEKDQLGLLATTDRRVVLRRVGTAQGQRGLTTEKLIAWLDALAKEEPFDLPEIGVDYVAGRFERSPADATAIAKRCAEIAPDLVMNRPSLMDLLAAEIKTNRTLYLIW